MLGREWGDGTFINYEELKKKTQCNLLEGNLAVQSESTNSHLFLRSFNFLTQTVSIINRPILLSNIYIVFCIY